MKRSLLLILSVLLLSLIVVPVSARLVAPQGDTQEQETKALFTAVQGDTVWEERSSPSSPRVRLAHGMVYDDNRHFTVLFGGHSDSMPLVLNDTWEWDGSHWSQRFPANAPLARYQHKLAYDRARGVVVLFGGLSHYGAFYGDTWEWDGTNWTQRFPSSAPPARDSYGLTYDSARERVVLFGGWDGASNLDDTWEWDGTNWTQRFPASTPPARICHRLAYDSTRNRVVWWMGWYQSSG
jgi:hypothetical protein